VAVRHVDVSGIKIPASHIAPVRERLRWSATASAAVATGYRHPC
jgi:hypothetical protein